MVLAATIRSARELVAQARSRGLSVGLVPTMGCLHEGHLALVRRARAECGFVVVSIFVNPLQFGPREDLAAYPRDLRRDLGLCEGAGADLVFSPEPAEMYSPGFRTHVEVEGLGRLLCGVTRPGHFRGVATVVAKLFNIVQPDRAYFGQKDYQQTLVLRRMAADLSFGLEIVVVPTVRHEDGLAMSSRNAYLGADERAAATVLFETLQLARELIASGERDGRRLRARLQENVEAQALARVDYVAVADPETLEPAAALSGTVLVALAVFIGRTRLIDNALISVPG
jgi:pantoate--beta-alanine ligase